MILLQPTRNGLGQVTGQVDFVGEQSDISKLDIDMKEYHEVNGTYHC